LLIIGFCKDNWVGTTVPKPSFPFINRVDPSKILGVGKPSELPSTTCTNLYSTLSLRSLTKKNILSGIGLIGLQKTLSEIRVLRVVISTSRESEFVSKLVDVSEFILADVFVPIVVAKITDRGIIGVGGAIFTILSIGLIYRNMGYLRIGTLIIGCTYGT
jgi:hypothetical protein